MDELERLLQAGPEATWPLPLGEDAAAWRAVTRAALASLEPLPPGVVQLARGPLAAPLAAVPGRARLVGELVRNLATPGRINQGHKSTCAVTVIESWLAEARPDQYAALVAALCGPDGRALLPDDSTLRRDEAVLTWDPAEAGRSPVSRLFQAAAMERAYGGLDYDDLRDRFLGPEGESVAGVGLGPFDALLESLTGEPWDVLTDRHGAMAAALGLDPATVPDLARDGLDRVARVLARGGPAFVTLLARGPRGRAPEVDAAAAHKVRVLAVEAARVVYEDPLDPPAPWIEGAGTEVLDRFGRCAMPTAAFVARMVELSTPARLRGPGDP